jgi:hypothetical protein
MHSGSGPPHPNGQADQSNDADTEQQNTTGLGDGSDLQRNLYWLIPTAIGL